MPGFMGASTFKRRYGKPANAWQGQDPYRQPLQGLYVKCESQALDKTATSGIRGFRKMNWLLGKATGSEQNQPKR
jgi:hypothetical protein